VQRPAETPDAEDAWQTQQLLAELEASAATVAARLTDEAAKLADVRELSKALESAARAVQTVSEQSRSQSSAPPMLSTPSANESL
jgi:hypothetical protein